MMRTSSIGGGWVLLTAMVVGLSVMFFIEWRSARGEKARLSDQLGRVVKEFERRMELADKRWGAALKGLEVGQEGLRVELRKLASQPAPALQPGAAPAYGVDGSGEPAPVDSTAESTAELPPLPPDIDPVPFLLEVKDLKSLCQDARFNPEGKELNRAQREAAQAELTRGRATGEILESEVRAEVAKGMDLLRGRGEFMEYARGEAPLPVEGVLSAGEQIEDGGMRVFYFYEEDFPRIYEKLQAKGSAAETAVRRLLAMVAGQPVEADAMAPPPAGNR